MIHALFTMSLAMPLEKMAKGEEKMAKGEAPKQTLSQYLIDRGCITGWLRNEGMDSGESFGELTYDELRESLPVFMRDHPDIPGTKIFLNFDEAPPRSLTIDGDTVLQGASIHPYSPADVIPWDAPETLEFSYEGAVSCPVGESDGPPGAAGPPGVAVHGDPMFQHDGKGQHFWIKEGVLTALLDWESDDGHKMSLQGLTVANAETGHQWFKQIALTSDGKKVLSSQAVFDDKPTLALSSLNTSTVTIDSFVKGNGVDAKDVTGVSAGGMTFELTAESAHKFVDTVQQQKYAHINVKMPHGITDGATGLFAEFAGAQPMSDATKALLRSPN